MLIDILYHFVQSLRLNHYPKLIKQWVLIYLTDFLVTSDGEKVKPLKVLIKYQKKLARAQKRLSKKLKGSNNGKKARLKVARIHNKISDSCKDFLHKSSSKLINENQVISLEDLNVAGMLGNHKLSKLVGVNLPAN